MEICERQEDRDCNGIRYIVRAKLISFNSRTYLGLNMYIFACILELPTIAVAF